MKGKVKWYNETKGYGFIRTDEGQEIFVHKSGLQEGLRRLNEEQEVEFDIEDGKKGKLAVNVRIIE